MVLSGTGSSSRCWHLIYDVGQISGALAATLAFHVFRCSKGQAAASAMRRLWNDYVASWLSFLLYVGSMALYVLNASPCSAVYSPGHARHPFGAFAYVLGGVQLLVESSLLALPCALLLYVYSLLIPGDGAGSCGG